MLTTRTFQTYIGSTEWVWSNFKFDSFSLHQITNFQQICGCGEARGTDQNGSNHIKFTTQKEQMVTNFATCVFFCRLSIKSHQNYINDKVWQYCSMDVKLTTVNCTGLGRLRPRFAPQRIQQLLEYFSLHPLSEKKTIINNNWQNMINFWCKNKTNDDLDTRSLL